MADLALIHVGLSVENLDRAVAWYREVFGFTEVKRFAKDAFEIQGAVLEREGAVLELLEPGVPEAAARGAGDLVKALRPCGVNHFALAVQDVKSLYAALSSRGVDLVTDLIDDRFFFCRDPDGSLIEVKQA